MSITKDKENSNTCSICPECGKSNETKTRSEVKLEENTHQSLFNKEKALKYAKWGGAAVTVACAVPMAAGFGTAGIVGGSFAAMWQSSIGNVVAGSAFATLQSLGATGVFATGAAAGTTASAGAFIAGKVSKKISEGNEHETNNEEGKEEKEPGKNSLDPDHEAKNETRVPSPLIRLRIIIAIAPILFVYPITRILLFLLLQFVGSHSFLIAFLVVTSLFWYLVASLLLYCFLSWHVLVCPSTCRPTRAR